MLSGVILEHLSWHWLFWFGAMPVVVALVLVVKLIPESPVRTPSRFDGWGVLTLSIGLSALLLALSEGERWGWLSALTLGVFALALRRAGPLGLGGDEGARPHDGHARSCASRRCSGPTCSP